MREDNYLFFYSHGRGDVNYVGLSNFAKSPITELHPLNILLGNVTYPTVEHYFAAYKTINLDEFERIRKISSPASAKSLGRKITLRSDWESVRVCVMLNALRLKFQIPEFNELLLSTNDKYLVEASPTDKIWGAELINGKLVGKNLLGKLLMQVRAELHA